VKQSQQREQKMSKNLKNLCSYLQPAANVMELYPTQEQLIVHQKTRTEAVTTMKRALREFVIEPVKTTIPACLDILSHNLFVKNKIDTGFVERNF